MIKRYDLHGFVSPEGEYVDKKHDPKWCKWEDVEKLVEVEWRKFDDLENDYANLINNINRLTAKSLRLRNEDWKSQQKEQL